MIQNFQCPTCGNLIAFGEPACTSCGQNFVYNCPVCGNPVDNRYIRCGSCKTLFNWSKPVQQNAEMNPVDPVNPPQERVNYTDIRQSRAGISEIKERTASSNLNMTSRPMFWLIL
ncbi:MAG: hypothetical protein NTZ34_07545, partial [Chloroflexi bacterium]|nr:hypothetical protein [Chloroflexota bacterium]